MVIDRACSGELKCTGTLSAALLVKVLDPRQDIPRANSCEGVSKTTASCL